MVWVETAKNDLRLLTPLLERMMSIFESLAIELRWWKVVRGSRSYL
tara:strand:- start:840 stop:977 length:138 start_codon:yes stop_codon:yes gene_type:complete